MNTEKEIRELLALLKYFDNPEAAKALMWVLGEYPPIAHVEPANPVEGKPQNEAK